MADTKSILWGPALGSILVMRPPDIANLCGLKENESIFLSQIEAIPIVLNNDNGIQYMVMDDLNAEAKDTFVDGGGLTEGIIAEVTEIVAQDGETIGGQIGSIGKNAIPFFHTITVNSVVLRIPTIRSVNKLIRRSLVFMKDDVDDAILWILQYEKFPTPMFWMNENDLGDLQKVTGENTAAGSEFFQPLRRPGEEFHSVGGAGV